MKFINCALTTIFLPLLLIAADNPAKLFTNTYDGRVQNDGEWNLSFFRKGIDVVSFDWNTQQEKIHQCNLPVAPFYAYQLSQQDSIFLLRRADTSISDGWVLDLSGSCLKVSELVKDFPSDNISIKLFYAEKLKQLVIRSTDYQIAPADGNVNVFIDLKAKTIVKKTPGLFYAGHRALQFQNTAISISDSGRFLNFFNTDSFTLEKSVDFGKLYISRLYLEESLKLGFNNQFLVSGADGGTFLGLYDNTTDQITKRFSNGCYDLKFSLEDNLALCYDTPPGGPWAYYTQDLTTGENSTIWTDLWHEPVLSSKNSLIIANKQNGHFSFFNIHTKQKTEFYSKANADDFFFLDKDEKYLISISNNWSGKVEIEKILIADPSETTLLYEIEIPSNDDYGYIIFSAEKNKLFIPLKNGGAYYLDVK